MTPIQSKDDVRLITLVGVAISAIEDLALHTQVEPDLILAEYLYTINKRVLSGEQDTYSTKLHSHYPLLKKAIE